MKAYLVSSQEAGIKLLAFLRGRLRESFHSVKSLKRAIDTGKCRVNERIETFSTHSLKKGDRVTLDLGQMERRVLTPDILYEDDQFLICDKPAGFLSDNRAFRAHFPHLQKTLHLAHRLDKETSGVILLAKHEKALEAAEALFAQREMHKYYLALVHGRIEIERGEIDNFLERKESYQGGAIWGGTTPGRGVRARTLWYCLRRSDRATLVLAEPITGRTHQIRVHFSEMGHPILGDIVYGREVRSDIQPPRQLLHASQLQFIDPFTKKRIEVKAPLPKDFTRISDALYPNH
jgi:RluA family pseudouridine synthase